MLGVIVNCSKTQNRCLTPSEAVFNAEGISVDQLFLGLNNH